MIVLDVIYKEGGVGKMGFPLPILGAMNVDASTGHVWVNYLNKGVHKAIKVSQTLAQIQEQMHRER